MKREVLFKFIFYSAALFLGTFLVWSVTQEKKDLAFDTYWIGLSIMTATLIWHYIRENPIAKIPQLLWFLAKCLLALLLASLVIGDNNTQQL